jgi:hypothetical protein
MTLPPAFVPTAIGTVAAPCEALPVDKVEVAVIRFELSTGIPMSSSSSSMFGISISIMKASSSSSSSSILLLLVVVVFIVIAVVVGSIGIFVAVAEAMVLAVVIVEDVSVTTFDNDEEADESVLTGGANGFDTIDGEEA